jgi:hypothetical protein
MAQVIPAKAVSQKPKFQFAVLSVCKDATIAELESSFASQGQAENMFERQYSKWGLTDVNFYLVDWTKQTILRSHEVWS